MTGGKAYIFGGNGSSRADNLPPSPGTPGKSGGESAFHKCHRRGILATLSRSTGRRGKRTAFTLPEVLAALVLIGIVLPPVLRGVSLAMGACDDAKRKIEATGLAESKLADLTVDAAQAVSSGGGSGTFPDHPDYSWDAQTVTQDTDLSEITVRVTWTARGAQRSIDLSTLVFTGTTGTSSTAALSTPATGGP